MQTIIAEIIKSNYHKSKYFCKLGTKLQAELCKESKEGTINFLQKIEYICKCIFNSGLENWVKKLLFGTNCTGEFFLWVIRWTSHSIAVSFNMVEQGTIGTGSTPWYCVWVLVNTLIHDTIVAIVL